MVETRVLALTCDFEQFAGAKKSIGVEVAAIDLMRFGPVAREQCRAAEHQFTDAVRCDDIGAGFEVD